MENSGNETNISTNTDTIPATDNMGFWKFLILLVGTGNLILGLVFASFYNNIQAYDKANISAHMGAFVRIGQMEKEIADQTQLIQQLQGCVGDLQVEVEKLNKKPKNLIDAKIDAHEVIIGSPTSLFRVYR